MGGDLPPAKGKAPTFIVWAVKDRRRATSTASRSSRAGRKNGQSFEKIYDVVWAGDRKPDKWTGVVPPIGSTVDIDNAAYTNTIGAVELKTVWTDPEFDPGVHAFYYARVLEIPTPRWTTIQAKELGIAPPDVVARHLQERAWSSPIWYTPSVEARKKAKAGTTVADLKKQGAVALDDVQLQVADSSQKSNWLQNNVTGDKYMIIYGALGKGAGAKPMPPSEAGTTRSVSRSIRAQFQLRYVGRRCTLQSLVGAASEAQPARQLAHVHHPERQDRHCARRYADRDHRVQTGRQVRGGAQQRVRLRELRDHSDSDSGEPACCHRGQQTALRRLLREPLIHFLLLGAVLFGAWQFWQRDSGALAPSHQIRLTVEELTQLALLFQSQWRREPTADEFSRLVENRVQEEVLYREALAMGLDKEDTIVKRRMAQKLQFLAEDVSAAREPDRAELEAWYARHSDTFAQPNRVSFRHLYFSPDRRGARAREDATNALTKLAGQPQDARLASVDRRCVHVPGLLPRPHTRAACQGVRATVRIGRGEACARLVAGTRPIRSRLAPRVHRHRGTGARAGVR